MDVLDGVLSLDDILTKDLPLVLDLLKAKTRLEESKSRARRQAQELAKLEKKGGLF